jgi:SET domain-containing protein
MPHSKTSLPLAESATPFHVVRDSKIHGKGVFAARKIPAEACIVEYTGERITDEVAADRGSYDPENPYHTFYFSLEEGNMIDGAVDGSDARWINHACEPNCEAREEEGRVFIYALRDIKRSEELNYDYGLILEERQTKALKRAYECRCGAASCRGTMLAPKEEKKKKKKKKKH